MVPADTGRVTVSPQLRAVLIAGALALTALALGFATLSMNQSSSSAAPKKILSLKERGLASKHAKAAAAKPTVKVKAKPKPVDPNLLAALHAGLPRSVALQLAAHPSTVVELYSKSDPIDQEAQDEAKAGAALAGAGFVSVDVDIENGAAPQLTRVMGALPPAPASLVYVRPATLYVTLTGFNDRTTVAQAAANAGSGATAPAATTTAPAATPTTPAGAPTLAG